MATGYYFILRTPEWYYSYLAYQKKELIMISLRPMGDNDDNDDDDF